MKPLTIEELKALKVGDWVWLPNKNTYAKFLFRFGCELAYQIGISNTYFKISEYGKTWLAYKNKEQAEAKGEIVELPKEKWAITRGGGKECPNYLVEHRNPKAEFWGGKWHISMEQIEWRDVVEEYDTEQEAEYKLAELKEDTQ